MINIFVPHTLLPIPPSTFLLLLPNSPFLAQKYVPTFKTDKHDAEQEGQSHREWLAATNEIMKRMPPEHLATLQHLLA
jgi:hypothetical protein